MKMERDKGRGKRHKIKYLVLLRQVTKMLDRFNISVSTFTPAK